MNEGKKISEDLEKAAEESWAVYEYRETPRGLYSSCYVDGFKAGAQWQKEQMMKELEGWKELAIRGMKKGATAYHQGKVALITDLEEWLMEDEK